ncbi:MAG: NifB/NifX family molybdenum-iron cluster-binding protein [Dehalococcoidales bacterium]|nr:NifB/NifX family molybdenum-iron cluster-binding protein [Dehalococcoidales bacterium]
MRIAISTEDNAGLDSTVSGHFGHCPYFVIVDLEEGQVTNVATTPNPYYSGHQPGQIPAFIHSQNADIMLSGGMGAGAINFFNSYGVAVGTGARGTVRQALESYLDGDLDSQSSCAGDHSCGR